MSDYRGKTVVVKYGGNAMINEELKALIMHDICELHDSGVRIVLVHGGGPEINRVMDALGKKPEFRDGLRVTDSETVDIVEMVLAGKVNKSLANLINSFGGCAVGISGIDSSLIECSLKDEKLGFVGKVEKVNITLVNDLLEKGYIPVISTVGCDRSGNAYNINGDTAACRIAGALDADRLIMMTDIAGLLRDVSDPGSLIKSITLSEAAVLRAEGIISGGMIPKMECCAEAIRCGVSSVSIIDGRVPHSLRSELSTPESTGTKVIGG